VERLFKILEYTTELKEAQLDRTEQLGDCHLPGLKANVDVALSMCNRVLQREENFNSVRAINPVIIFWNFIFFKDIWKYIYMSQFYRIMF